MLLNGARILNHWKWGKGSTVLLDRYLLAEYQEPVIHGLQARAIT